MYRGFRLARFQATLAVSARTALMRPAMRSALRFYATEPVTSDLSAVDSEFVAALRQEHRIETETVNSETDKEDKSYFDSFLETSGFEVVAKDGHEEVVLVKQTGSETIRVFFGVSDAVDADSMLEDSAAESAEGEQAAAQEEVEDFDEEIDTPIRLNIIVEKPKGAVAFEAIAQDDVLVIESITPYESGSLARDESAEADYRRRLAYQGPPFAVLDPSVQGAAQEFLEARGINSDLALFVSEYAGFRENKEYIDWLARVADIIES